MKGQLTAQGWYKQDADCRANLDDAAVALKEQMSRLAVSCVLWTTGGVLCLRGCRMTTVRANKTPSESI
jgi:hypothetical protein